MFSLDPPRLPTPIARPGVLLSIPDGPPGASSTSTLLVPAPPGGDDATSGYRLGRRIADALMGRVVAGVEVVRGSAGWAPPTPARRVAVKQLSKACIAGRHTISGRPVREDPWAEIAVLAHLGRPGHPNVLRMVDLLQDGEHVFLVLELLSGGELFAEVARLGRVPELDAKRYFSELLQGVRYCHAAGVAHRDLSLENAMFTGGEGEAPPVGGAGASPPPCGVVKLIDFGLAVRLPPPGGMLLPEPQRVGKDRYMAPEIWALSPYDPVPADVWCLGMCLCLLLFGSYPYAVPDPALCPYFAEIQAKGVGALLRAWGFGDLVSPPALQLVQAILQPNPCNRPTIEQIVMSGWLG